MMYEISREAFKQRLEDKKNFSILCLNSAGITLFEGTQEVTYSSDFLSKVEKLAPTKSQNILLFSFKSGDQNLSAAASDLHKAGYNFVYYYQGTVKDVVLDKGLN